MAKKPVDRGIAYLGLSAFLIVFQADEVMGFGVLFPALVLLAAASACILVAQFLLFNSGNGSRRQQAAAAACIALLTILELALLTSKGYILADNFKFLQYLTLSCFMIIASLLPLLFGAEILRRFRDRRLRILGLMLVAFAVFAVVYFFIVGFSGVSVVDAGWLTYQGDRALLAGHNPYILNYSGLYSAVSNGTSNSFTITTGGRIVGLLGYPFLYLALSMPFVMASADLVQFSHILLFQEIAFTLLLFGLIAYFGRKINRREFVALMLVVSLLFFTLISITDIVMIAALLIAYLRPGRWYFGVALGIAVSIQQLAWVPALLLLLHSLANSKRGKAALDLGVAAATVLAVNGYFLLAGPLTYMHDLIGQLGGVLPTTLSPFGALIIRYCNIPLPYFQILFYLALAASAIAFLWLGRRRNFAILSLVPFLFLSFSRIEYYTVFMVIGIVAAVLVRDEKGAAIEARSRVVAIALAVLAVAMVVVVLYGHAVYLRSFPVTVSDPSAVLVSGNAIYSAPISTGSLSGYERVLLYSFYGNNSGNAVVFITGETVVLEGQGGNSTYSYNGLDGELDNRIYVQAGPLRPARMAITSLNDSGAYLACAVYNESYFYLCPTVGSAISNS